MIRDFINIKDQNNQIDSNFMKVILDNESRYREQLFKLANKIIFSKKNKIVLLAGPSCAGKTTTAKILKEILEKKKKHVLVISMDDFFFNREDTPLLPNGMKDYDSIKAINLNQMKQCFEELFSKGKAKFPIFDFKNGKNIPNAIELEFTRNTIIIFEGLHVLNPKIPAYLGTDKFFKIYASAISGFELGKVKMSTRQVRLVRRMIRDAERRGHSPLETLKTWKNVCEAEDCYISPYKNNVDYEINTTHAYEVALFKKELFEIICNNRSVLSQLPFLEIFDESVHLDKDYLPETSLMWEFINKPVKDKTKLIK